MCGRFAFFSKGEVLATLYGVVLPEPLPPRYNVPPSEPVLVVREEEGKVRAAALLSWGLLPSWSKDPSPAKRFVNARAETAGEKPAFRASFRRRRCVVPADGFFEWKREGTLKTPWFFRPRGGGLFSLGAVWDRWLGPDGEELETVAILTTAANGVVAPVHDRMPVLVAPGALPRWLDRKEEDPRALAPLLAPFPEEGMEGYVVPHRVNDPRADDPSLVLPAGSAA
jgi:putative SOS response-associated peptidase YedK